MLSLKKKNYGELTSSIGGTANTLTRTQTFQTVWRPWSVYVLPNVVFATGKLQDVETFVRAVVHGAIHVWFVYHVLIGGLILPIFRNAKQRGIINVRRKSCCDRRKNKRA